MDVPQDSSPSRQNADEITPTDPECVKVTVKGITAKFLLNRPADELIPLRYLKKGIKTVAVRREAWIFRNGKEDGREVNIGEWPEVDHRYRGVFSRLSICPDFAKGLWERGSESCQNTLNSTSPFAQASVIYALLHEVDAMLKLKRPAAYGGSFFLTPRLLYSHMEYWTGFREKHQDAPETDGFLVLEFRPSFAWVLILPVSTTTKEETLESALQGKFKLILGQLLHHVRPLRLPADKLPDQEIFLIGLHGSKFHLMRAFFPGQKLSSLWCRRELPPAWSLAAANLDIDPMLMDTPHTEQTEGMYLDASLGEPVGTAHTGRARSTSGRFYAHQFMDRVQQEVEAKWLKSLDNEPDVRTFRVLATYEYDLWQGSEFTAAVQILAALNMYLLSGYAQCGALQDTFAKYYPYVIGNAFRSASPEDSDDDSDAALPGDEPDKETLFEWKGEWVSREEWVRHLEMTREEGSDDDAHAALPDDELYQDETLFEEQGDWVRREEMTSEENLQASQVGENMDNDPDNHVSSLNDVSWERWDYAWNEPEESLVDMGEADVDSDGGADVDGDGDQNSDEDLEMVVGNLDL